MGRRHRCQNQAMDDIVCQMVRGELAVDPVLRTDRTIAFLDHRPVFKGHVLVCPVAHADDLVDLRAEAVGELFADVRRIAEALPRALGCQGSFVGINNRVSQSVSHLHVHVVPRTKGDGLRGFFWPRVKYAQGEQEQYLALIKGALE